MRFTVQLIDRPALAEPLCPQAGDVLIANSAQHVGDIVEVSNRSATVELNQSGPVVEIAFSDLCLAGIGPPNAWTTWRIGR